PSFTNGHAATCAGLPAKVLAMPLEVIESTDPLTSLIRFETSPVFEMLVSLRTLLTPDLQPEWNAQARAALSPELLQELEAIYGPYWDGFLFLELAIDCP